MKQARLAVPTSTVPVKVALDNIHNTEATSPTYFELKKYAKGENCSTFQRVQIPTIDISSHRIGVITSITNSFDLFSSIPSQNVHHFSQAINTPGVSGHLGKIILPF